MVFARYQEFVLGDLLGLSWLPVLSFEYLVLENGKLEIKSFNIAILINPGNSCLRLLVSICEHLTTKFSWGQGAFLMTTFTLILSLFSLAHTLHLYYPCKLSHSSTTDNDFRNFISRAREILLSLSRVFQSGCTPLGCHEWVMRSLSGSREEREVKNKNQRICKPKFHNLGSLSSW